MPAGGRPTMRSRRLGSALRRYREAAKLDQQQVADYIAGSKTKISRIESGQVSARPGDVRLMLELYGVEDREVYTSLEQLARDSNKRGWWFNFPWVTKDPGLADFITLETDAVFIRTWQPLFIPGLLQTDGYLTTLMTPRGIDASPVTLEDGIEMRRMRRKLIEEGGVPYAAVIWEPALTAPMHSPKIHREQLLHILNVAQRQNVRIQVLPMSEWRAAHLASHFVMLSFGPEPGPDAVVFDTTSGTVVVEDAQEMVTHTRIFEELGAAALTPDQSLSFLRNALRNIPEEEGE